LVTYFTEGRSENIFNSNLFINFSYSFSPKLLKRVTAMPTTIAAERRLKTSLVNNDDPVVICETILFIFDIESERK